MMILSDIIIKETFLKLTSSMQKDDILVIKNPNKIQMGNILTISSGHAQMILNKNGSLYIWSAKDISVDEVVHGLQIDLGVYGIINDQRHINIVSSKNSKLLRSIKKNKNLIDAVGKITVIKDIAVSN